MGKVVFRASSRDEAIRITDSLLRTALPVLVEPGHV